MKVTSTKAEADHWRNVIASMDDEQFVQWIRGYAEARMRSKHPERFGPLASHPDCIFEVRKDWSKKEERTT